MPNSTPKLQQFLALTLAIGLTTWLIVSEQNRADQAVGRRDAGIESRDVGTSKASGITIDPDAEVQGEGASDDAASSINAEATRQLEELLRAQREPYLHSSKVLTLRQPQELDPETVFLFSSKSMVIPEPVGSPIFDLDATAANVAGPRPGYSTWSTSDLNRRRADLVEELRRIDAVLGDR